MILAQQGSGDIFSKAVEFFTGSPWTHVALVADTHGNMIESMFPMGVRTYSLWGRQEELNERGVRWALLDIPDLTDAQRAKMVDTAFTYLGRRYDYLQCLLIGLLGRFIADGPLRVICSRLITAAALGAEVNIFDQVTPPPTYSRSRVKGMQSGYCVPADIVEHSRYRVIGVSE